MGIFDDSNLIVKIAEEDINNAVISTKNIKEDLKERAFANVLGASLGLKFLQTLEIDASNENSLYTINSILSDIDVSDIYVKNIKIDVRICQDEKHLCVPASHFEYGLTPDVYIFFILSKDMSFAAFVGTTAPSEVKRNKSIDGYYLVSKKNLYSAKSLKNVLTRVKPKTNISADKSAEEKAQSLIIQFVDDDILNTEKHFLYEQLNKNIELRNYFKEFENFEFVSKNIANTDDILSGTLLDMFDRISDETENEFVESFQNESDDNNDIFNEANFESDEVQDDDDIYLNNENPESFSALPDDETLANFSAYEPENDIENDNNEDDDFKLEDVGFAGFEGLKASNSISDTALDANIINFDNDITYNNEDINNIHDFDKDQNNNSNTLGDIELEKMSSKNQEVSTPEKIPEKPKDLKTKLQEMDDILAEAINSSNDSDNTNETDDTAYEDIFEEIDHEQVKKVNLEGKLDDIKNTQDIEELVYDDSYEKAQKNEEYLKEMIKIEAMEEPPSSSEFEEVNDSESMEEVTSDNNFEEVKDAENMEEVSTDNNFEEVKDTENMEEVSTDNNFEEVKDTENMEEESSDNNFEDVKDTENMEEVSTDNNFEEVKDTENMEEESSDNNFEDVNNTENLTELTSDISIEEMNSPENLEGIAIDNGFEDVSSTENLEEISSDLNLEEINSSENLKEIAIDNGSEDVSSTENLEEISSDLNLEEMNSSENLEEIAIDNGFEDVSNTENLEEFSSDLNLEEINSSENLEEISSDINLEEFNNTSEDFGEIKEEVDINNVEISTIDNQTQEDIQTEFSNTDSDEEVTSEDFAKLDELSDSLDNVLAPLDGNLDSLEPVDEDFNMNSAVSKNEEQDFTDSNINKEETVLSNNINELEQIQNTDTNNENLEEIHDTSNEFDTPLQELQPLEDLSSTANEAFEEVNLESMENSSLEPLENSSDDNISNSENFSQITDDNTFEEVNLETTDNSNFGTVEELPAENDTYADSFAQINDNNTFEEINLETTDNSSFETIKESPAENNNYENNFDQVNDNNNFEEVNLETTDNSSFETIDNTTADNFSNNNLESSETDNIDEFTDAFSGFSDMDDESSSGNNIEDINLDSLDGDDDDIDIDNIGNIDDIDIDDIDIDNIDIDNISTDDIDLSNINLDDIELDDDLNGIAIEDFTPTENISNNNEQIQTPIGNEQEYQPDYNENDKDTLEKLYQENTQDKIPGNGDKMDNSLDKNNVNPTNVTNQSKPKQKSNTALLLLVFVALLGFVGYTKKDLIMEQINNLRGGSSDSVLITEEQNNMPVEGEESNNTPPPETPAPQTEGEQPQPQEGEQPQQQAEQQPAQPVGAIPGEAGGPQDAKSMEESLKRAQKPQSIDKIAQPATKMSEPLSSAQISKLYWEVPKDLTYNENVTKYLQVVGKTSKLAIQSDLLNVTEMPYSSKMIVTVKLSRTGDVIDAIAAISSGSKQVDSIVLQSVKSAMKYVKAPTSEFTKESYDFSLIINF